MFIRTLTLAAAAALVTLAIPIAAAEKKAPGQKKEKIYGEGSTDGTFVEVEQGDYFYFVINDQKGERQAFTILTEPPSVVRYTKRPKAFVGKPVRVYWQEKSRWVPEANEMIRDKICLRVEAPKS